MRRRRNDSGFALLLVFLMAAVIAISLYMEIPRIAFESQRQKEQLLIDRGEQYKRAIQVFFTTNKRYPTRIEELESLNNRRFLRRRYVDPMTGKDEWRVVHVQNGVLTDSKVVKPQQGGEKKEQSAAAGFITEQTYIGAAPTGATSGVNLATRRRATEGGNPGGGGFPGQPGMPGMAPAPVAADSGAQPQPFPNPSGTPNLPQGAQAINVVPGQGGVPAVPGGGVSGYPPGVVVQGYPGTQGYPPGVMPGQPGTQGYPPGVVPGQPGTQGYPPGVIPGQPVTQGYPPGVVPGQPGMQGYPPGQVVSMPVRTPGYPPGAPVPGQPGIAGRGQTAQTGGSSAASYVGVSGPYIGGSAVSQPAVPGTPGMPVRGFPGPPVNSQTGGVSAYPTSPGAVGTPPGFGQPGMNPQAQNAAAAMIQQILTQPRPGGAPQAQMQGAIGSGIAGFASNADEEGIMVYNDRTNYGEWEFIFDPAKMKQLANPNTGAPGTPAAQMGNMPGTPVGTPAQQLGTFPGQTGPSPFGSSPNPSPFGSGPNPNPSPFGSAPNPNPNPFGGTSPFPSPRR